LAWREHTGSAVVARDVSCIMDLSPTWQRNETRMLAATACGPWRSLKRSSEDQEVPVGIAARTNTAAIALPILLLALAEPACAQADCATHPPRPEAPAIVTGSPGERLYIQPQHPSLCKDVQSGTCKAKSYVLTGDVVRVAPECDNWVLCRSRARRRRPPGLVAEHAHRARPPIRLGGPQSVRVCTRALLWSQRACVYSRRNRRPSRSCGSEHCLAD